MPIIHFIFLLVMFLGGMYFYGKYTNPKILENLENKLKPRCPNLLIQVGSKYYLYNSNVEKVSGVNPIEFANLEDYTEFLKWQQNVGIKCPVLYVQNTYDAQGNRVYKVRPSVLEPQGGLPSTTTTTQSVKSPIDTRTINNTMPDKMSDIMKNSSFKTDKIDFSNQNIEYPDSLAPITPSFSTFSEDPMNINWGGNSYAEKVVSEGKYAANEVSFY